MGNKQKKSIFKRWWFWIAAVFLLFIIIGTANSKKPLSSSGSLSNQTNISKATPGTNKTTPKSGQRQVTGKAADLGAGTFEGGKDITAGVYDAASAEGQGNFTVNSSSGELLANEILGNSGEIGVSKVRVKISNGDVIKLQGINKTHFEPVTASFVKSVQNVSLYAGRFIVGEDIAAGRYVASAPSGSGNFVVYSSKMPVVNEILGQSGVKNVTVDLKNGNEINIAGLNQVNFVPVK